MKLPLKSRFNNLKGGYVKNAQTLVQTKKYTVIASLISLIACLIFLSLGGAVFSSSADDAAELYDPTQVLEFHVQLEQSDWNTIRNDETFDIEVPCDFWVENEDPPMDPIRAPKLSHYLGAFC